MSRLCHGHILLDNVYGEPQAWIMKSQSRKLPRFYIINPVTDRRFEQRFESREPVMVQFDKTGKSYPTIAYDINRRGMRLESNNRLTAGSEIQVVFSNSHEHVRCYGHIVWSRPIEERGDYEGGVAVDGWFGIIEGENSWKKFKGFKPKRDRRTRTR